MSATRYTKSHEWCRLAGEVAVCGISKHAAEELNDIVFIDVQKEPGESVEQGDEIGEIDSTKTSSPIYAPVAGEIAAINERYNGDGKEGELPEVTEDPEGKGWLFKIKPADASALDSLLDEEAYRAHCADG